MLLYWYLTCVDQSSDEFEYVYCNVDGSEDARFTVYEDEER